MRTGFVAVLLVLFYWVCCNGQTNNVKTECGLPNQGELLLETSAPYRSMEDDPTEWTFKVFKGQQDTLLLIFSAEVDENWKVYSNSVEEGGPIGTSLNYEDSSGTSYQVIDDIQECGAKIEEGIDDIFETYVKSYSKKATFQFKTILQDPSTTPKGFIEYMACDNITGICRPPTPAYFDFNIQEGSIYLGDEKFDETIDGSDNDPTDTVGTMGFGKYPLDSLVMESAVSDCGIAEVEEEGKDLWSIFILGFLGGLIALLTPCVFPMIPLTVSFFTKGSTDKKKGVFNAFVYGLFIFLIYLLLSVPFHLLDSINPDILNEISTNIWLNGIFFVVFVVFAISFFGYFEITLPSSIANKADSASDIGGLLGTFFMALTLAIVSFSCTGPILGSLLAGALSSDGGAIQLTAGMGGFGLALALPFALFAAFPGWLNSLPKSGGWLNTVKVVIGFIELALAFKFLSNADLVIHAGLLKRETFFAIWILIGLGLFLYLIGKIKFPHDSPLNSLSKGRIGFAIFVLAFTLYLVPGVTCTKYSNLTLLSGFPPPGYYSFCAEGNCPLDLDCHKNDFDAAMDNAISSGKPLLVDMTGWACVNCRRMEEKVWTDERIFKLIKEEFILVSLYVDDRESLPEDEQIIVKLDGRSRKLRTVGNRWSFFSQKHFNSTSQPYYILLSPDADGELLNMPVGYTPDANDYLNFLECGLEAHQENIAAKGT